MKDIERARFYTQLARLLDSGIAPGQSLAMLGDEGAGLAQALRDGQTLSRAWRKDSRFGEMEAWVIEVGEVSGKLSVCLEGLAEHFERQARLKRKMLSKLLYPVVLFHAVFLLPPLGLLLTQGFDAYLRVAVLPLSIAWILIVGAAFLSKQIRSSPAAASRFDRVLLRWPVVGRILRDRAIAVYGHGLALLLGAGLPLLDSLDRAARMVPNRWIRAMGERVTGKVRRGASIADSMVASFPATFVEMVRVGEASGRLEEQLESAACYFDQEGQTALTRFVTISSFLVFLLAAIVVGAVVIRSWLLILGL